VHETFSERKLLELKAQHPSAEIIAHPECEAPILRHAQFIGSTTALLNYTQRSAANAFIVATESGILHQMQRQNPQKQYIPAPPTGTCACNECPYMRLNTLEKLYWAMKRRSPEVTVPEATRQAALRPIQRMLDMST
jgi:quinolinate synthase